MVDTHTHFYDPTRPMGVPWPPKNSSLYRPVYPRDWIEVARPCGVTHTVVVEASNWLEDNQWILDLATQNQTIIGFVGNLSPNHNEFEKQLQRFSQNRLFRGIRVSGALPSLVEDRDFLHGIRLLCDRGLQLDVNGPVSMHLATLKLSQKFPELRIIVDHVGSAGDARVITDDWKSIMRRLSSESNVYCKVSALLEQSTPAQKQPGSAPSDLEYYLPVLDHCWECFGEDRLLYGSNWPVCEKGGTYGQQFQLVDQYFQSKGVVALEKYFRRNAVTAYRLPDPATPS